MEKELEGGYCGVLREEEYCDCYCVCIEGTRRIRFYCEFSRKGLKELDKKVYYGVFHLTRRLLHVF